MMMKTTSNSKASNLKQLLSIGSRVPEFIVLHKDIIENINDIRLHRHIMQDAVLGKLEDVFGKTYADKLYSVRSSGNYSTPGRMLTILNVIAKTEQIFDALKKVIDSSNDSNVKTYLSAKCIQDFEFEIIMQEMIDASDNMKNCSGVLTTIHPVTQNSELYGNIVFGQTGDKLMSGLTNCHQLHELVDVDLTGYISLVKQVEIIQQHFEKPQEIEFVIKDSTAWILQTRDFTRHNLAEIEDIEQFIHSINLRGQGQSATPFSCIGEVTYDRRNCKNKILIIDYTEFEDVEQLIECLGIITKIGGILSHAAIIARDLNKPCIVGAKFINDPREGDIVILHYKGGIFKK